MRISTAHILNTKKLITKINNMGLNTSHNCWHGAYSSFHNFRIALAREIGYNLLEFDGFEGRRSFSEMNHPIKPLLDHSDCDGELTPEECRDIANGLQQILNGLSSGKQYPLFFADNVRQFMNGCLDAANKNECVEFH